MSDPETELTTADDLTLISEMVTVLPEEQREAALKKLHTYYPRHRGGRFRAFQPATSPPIFRLSEVGEYVAGVIGVDYDDMVAHIIANRALDR